MQPAQSKSEDASIPRCAGLLGNMIQLSGVAGRYRSILWLIFMCRSAGGWTLRARAQITKQMFGRVDVAK